MSPELTSPDQAEPPLLDNKALYEHLNKVSRSFALTIPLMSNPLQEYVGLAYLICRIVDTVEDDAKASLEDKINWLSDFSFLASDEFADLNVLTVLKERALELTQQGSAPDDVALIKDIEPTINLLLTYPEEVKKTICHAAAILSHGMAAALRQQCDGEKITSLDAVDNYCYFVAGVVGEMLAELFALFDQKCDKRELLELAVSFGEGLQLTNILRDRLKDEARGMSYLPAQNAEDVLNYVAITQGHLDDAVDFISKLSPKESRGVRLFCFANVIMAKYLLRQVARRPLDPQCNYQISRHTVKKLLILSHSAARSNTALRLISFFISLGMKRQHRSARELRDKVSLWDHSSSTN